MKCSSAGARPILVTGFGPFPGARFNPTEPLVAKLLAARWPALAGLKVTGHVFRTSYAAVDAELPQLIARHKPHAILMFGLAARTKFVRIEIRARNARSSLLPDVSRAVPETRRIRPDGPTSLQGRAPFATIAAVARKSRLPVRLSHNVGRYLCNYAYWRAIEAAGPAPLVLFVHVPKLPSGSRPRRARRDKRRPLAFPDLARAAEAILRTLATAARR
jgi:pyroglutamyl-peptidase